MATAPTPHTPLPTPPSTDDPTNFDARADAFLPALEVLADEQDATAQEVYDNAVEAYDSATTAGQHKDLAEDWATSTDVVSGGFKGARGYAIDADASADAAAASAASALNAPGTNATCSDALAVSAGTKAFTLDQTGKLYSPGQRLLFASEADVANRMSGILQDGYDTASGVGEILVGALDFHGSGSHGDWLVSLTGEPGESAAFPASAKSGAYSVVSGDRARHFVLTSTATLTLLAAATAGDGFIFYVRNDGSGIWTIDPDGAETIDGRATIKVYPGENFAVISDGVAWRTFGRARGPILISTTTIGGVVASVDFETGFDDTEFTQFQLVGEGLSSDASGGTYALRVKKSGAYVTTSTYSSTGTGGTAIGFAVSTGAGQQVAFRADVAAPGAGPVIALWAVDGSPAVAILAASESAAAALQGLRLFDTVNSLDAGTLRLYGIR